MPKAKDWEAASVADIDAELERLQVEKASIRERQLELTRLRDAKAQVDLALRMAGHPTTVARIRSEVEAEQAARAGNGG